VTVQRIAIPSPDRRFQFQKRSQRVISAHNETLSIIAVSISNKDRSRVKPTVATQPPLQPALLRLSAIISQYFTQQIVALLLSTQQQRTKQQRSSEAYIEAIAPSFP
jgi:hypothetical protein